MQQKDLLFPWFTVLENVLLGPDSKNINKDALPDKRSYRVNFGLFNKLARPSYITKMNLNDTISDIIVGLKLIGFDDKNFRKSNFMRLNVLKNLINEDYLNNKLFWKY